MFKIDAWYDNAALVSKNKKRIDVCKIEIALCKLSNRFNGENFNIRVIYCEDVKGITHIDYINKNNIDFNTACFQVISLVESFNVICESVLISFCDMTENLEYHEIKNEFVVFLQNHRIKRTYK
ncbi:MAG: hypothetical protein Q4F95_15175 [Oscillospiraceae bacterium]|nr:hypothetical protein [Oscillospiraceae bacterium]